jgi:hypothetical protein
MMDNGKVVETIAKTYANVDISGKAFMVIGIIAIVAFVVLGGLQTWGNVNQQNLTKSIQGFVDRAEEIDEFKDCVYDTYKDADEAYKDDLLPYLAQLLASSGIIMPEGLNDELLKYQKKFEKIKDCLVSPDKVK